MADDPYIKVADALYEIQSLREQVAQLASMVRMQEGQLDEAREATASAYMRGWLAGRDAAAHAAEEWNWRLGEATHEAKGRLQEAIRVLTSPGAPQEKKTALLARPVKEEK